MLGLITSYGTYCEAVAKWSVLACQYLTNDMRDVKVALCMYNAAEVLHVLCAMVNDHCSQQ